MRSTSKYATTILFFVLLAHVAANVESSSQADQETGDSASGTRFQDNQQDRGQGSAVDDGHKTLAWRNIDLIELTPNLEQQLFQAKRLNDADPGSMIELAKLTSDAYRYEMDNGGENQQRETAHYNRPTAGSRLSRQVMNDLHLLNNARRMSNSDSYEKTSINNNGNEFQQLRFSRGSTRPSFGRSGAGAASLQRASEQDGDYYSTLLSSASGGDGGAPSSASSALSLSSSSSSSSAAAPTAASIGNQEEASRKSLWTSELLRDLLIAQETRNRARLIEKLARAYEHDRGVHQNSINAQGTVETSEREKRRRCKVDPNLGVKNPSFCDTDAYFGAADYSMRDVWDSAGR